MATATIEDVLNKYSYMDTLDKKILRNCSGYGRTGIFDIAPTLLVGKQGVVFIREDKEKKTKEMIVGNLNYYNYDTMNKVMDTTDVSLTLTTMSGGGRQPKILCLIDDTNSWGKEKRCLISHSPCLRAARYGILAVIDENKNNTMNKEQYLLNGDKEGNASTHPTVHHYEGNITSPKGGHKEKGVVEREVNGQIERYNIRRLTPRECYRLMDVDEKYIDLLLSNPKIARSNHYKLAGNSIVVSCMYHIFKNLFDVNNTNN